MPFRFPSAGIISYAGETALGEVPYDLVFVSWNSPEPQEDFDQYIVRVNQQTKLVDYLRYTVLLRTLQPRAAPGSSSDLRPRACLQHESRESPDTRLRATNLVG